MPVVINEIEINVEVIPNDHSQVGSSSVSDNADLKESIIKECVEKVMEIINHIKER